MYFLHKFLIVRNYSTKAKCVCNVGKDEDNVKTGEDMREKTVKTHLMLSVVLLTASLFTVNLIAVVESKGMPWHSDLVNIRGTKGDDYFEAYDQHNFQYRTFSGNDFVDLTEAGGQNYVDAGRDNDTVVDSPYYDTIRLGDGDDKATHTGGNDIIAGDDGDDLFEIYVDQVLTAPDPPYDVGGPFVTRIDGGDGVDTARFILNLATDPGYKEAIIEAFETWRQTDPMGELDLNQATESFSQPLNIILVDIEILEITDSTPDQIVYTFP